jgi:hypothetical protein
MISILKKDPDFCNGVMPVTPRQAPACCVKFSEDAATGLTSARFGTYTYSNY